ncbi:MAG: lysine--tRNA ligase [Spirochaetales bacterium]|nr:lysine--tRNA ligase [Spirochaetales bacterium]
MSTPQSTHWADITADKIIREKGEKDRYVCASGITPSGTVHIGNFREIISVELVVRALRDKGKNVRFIYSWDDYDVFRKVPANMPKQDELKTYLRKPITLVPDPFGKEKSYARANEVNVETVLPIVGISPEYICQAGQYNNSVYANGMKTALDHTDTIKGILNEHRSEDLAADWLPVSVFCTKCDRDTTSVNRGADEWHVEYSCSSCGNSETLDLRTAHTVKLFWRIDWPMRWQYEKVDFEPAGKEHHSAGGSFDTAHRIAEEVYDFKAPVTFKYDFISLKGMGGKISSSLGNVVSLKEVLEIYQPEVVRFLFAGTRPNTEFAISFDLDVLKIYEDYDKCERIYYGAQEISDSKKDKEARIYELSQVGKPDAEMPYQMPLRHLCNLLQINSGDIEAVIAGITDLKESQVPRFRQRAVCAWNWITSYAPEDFRFALQDSPGTSGFSTNEKAALAALRDTVGSLEQYDEKALAEKIYEIAHANTLEPADFFRVVYLTLIGKEKGPRLAGFIMTVGKEKILEILAGI